MKIGDKVRLTKDVTCDNLKADVEYLVSAILADPDNEGFYWVHLEGFEDKPFAETLFEVLPEEPPTPDEDVRAKLEHWRSELIQAENMDDRHEAEKCRKYLDFYLDKMLQLKQAATQTQQPEQ